ncbi:MAG: hypothetical protein OER86_07120, partial [Phycisphaerae bacterium]|nr:hypothetical protein [Phycisphaerae bacterium]
TADEMVLFDTLDRPTPVAWERVMAFAAGRVEGIVFAETSESVISKDEYGHTVWSHTSSKEQSETTLLADLLLDIEPYRYQMSAEQFHYGYLGDRRTHDADVNFLHVVRDVCRFARLAALNRGAREVIETGRLPHTYPSRHAYEEELTWMMWRLQKQLDKSR